jgi:fructokinase
LYLTVGTGIGGGAVINGRPLHGLLHPEMGHIRIPHDRKADPFPGACPWHGDCLEGLASGTAMTQRWGKSGADLPPGHPAWNLEAEYLAAACASLTCTLSPHIILLGGGVMDHHGLIAHVQEKTTALLNGYLPEPRISLPGLGSRAGLCGALALGLEVAVR